MVGPDSNLCGITLPQKKPTRKIGLILWLHGGMSSNNSAKGAEAHRVLLPFVNDRDYYICSPSAFAGQDWLSTGGLRHIDALIDYMLLRYPIDPGNITMVGVSDGSLGVIAYSTAGKYPLRRRLLISSYPQIAIPLESLAGHAEFAKGKWDFLQGGQDRLFPATEVMPYLDRWKSLYPNTTVHYYPDGEHDFSFYAARSQNLLKSLLIAD
jgi:pimeloyl-ACP methyl ester carboxylesterase